MSYYITANIKINFKEKTVFLEEVEKLLKNDWIKEIGDNKFFFTDELGEVENTEVPAIDFNNNTIFINNLYMRYGLNIIEPLIKIANVNGKIISTDGRDSFTEIHDSKVLEISADKIFSEQGFSLKKYEDFEDKEAYEDYLYEKDKIMYDWVCNIS